MNTEKNPIPNRPSVFKAARIGGQCHSEIVKQEGTA
jgi:hypothetical protein